MLMTEIAFGETSARINTPASSRAHAVERDVKGRRLASCSGSVRVIDRKTSSFL
jgi:hypothetical protein